MSRELSRPRKRPRRPQVRGNRVVVTLSTSSSSEDEHIFESERDRTKFHKYVYRRATSNGTFCDCSGNSSTNNCSCTCNEEHSDTEWQWDNPIPPPNTTVSDVYLENREVWFHKNYSCGTAAARGSMPMIDGQHYWEIKMISPVYGTDMMVGVGTDELDLTKYHTKFCSLLGLDHNSWGLSYTGHMQHDGTPKRYCSKFGQNTVVGVHLNTWSGTLSFYINRQPSGVAFKGLQGKKLYPVVCSTAARTGMKIVKTRSFPTTLQFLCCDAIRRYIPKDLKVLAVLELPPGLQSFLQDNLGWLLDTCVMNEKKELCTTGTQTSLTLRDIRHVSDP
ncbi:SPRY domain-containing SOCS box protein 3-like [Saccoglossus kowalevskii]|uniref:SPRY domain-containing SOCS box protein 3 n=1 Tax=Saccoglossus kowalevskii TaxID=10224 RepID=A0ABM0GT95_SACKO|nr:PREDICTED: SPRY domain-containing SOCS box protein 3-like [Saccoglossus kowalevskii]